MRLLVFHGYLLRGTGSNVYNARLAETLVALGHDVDLICQERSPDELGFVDAVGEWRDGKLGVREVSRRAHAGSCTVYRPDIGGLLPVYVYDRYEWFEARTFDRLTDEELDRYLALNVSAVRDVAARAEPHAALANHLVMGPAILARALARQVPYAVKIHGSALEYTVKPHYARFAAYAREGLVGARAVLVGSRHTAESLWAALPLEGLRERTRLGPPGVDTHTFAPRGKAEAAAQLDGLVRWLETAERTGFDARAAEALDLLCAPGRGRPPSAGELAQVRAGYDPDGIDVAAPAALASIDPRTQPVVCFVGKLIVSKGLDLLLAAWPLVLAREPRARLVVVAFGTYREGLEVLLRGLEAADERLIEHVVRCGRGLEGGPRDRLTYLQSFLERLGRRQERYFAAARHMRETIVFTGRLDHGELAKLLPAAEAVVVPSMFSEAFGMVAAEAAACGALPVCAGHSGLAEVTESLAEGLSNEVRPMLTFERGMRAADGIAEALIDWLELDERRRSAARVRLAEAAARRFGWEQVAEWVLLATQGKLTRLEPVGVRLPFAPSG